MIRGIALAIALLLAGPAVAQEATTGSQAKSPVAKSGAKKASKAAKKGGAAAGQPGPAGAKSGPPNKELRQAKVSLRAAAGACSRPGDCDETSKRADRESLGLLRSAEENFMTVCLSCSTQEKCDQERKRMVDGKTSLGNAPCP